MIQWCILLILYKVTRDPSKGFQKSCMGSIDRKISDCSIPYKPYHLDINRPSFPIFHNLKWSEGCRYFFRCHNMFRRDILYQIFISVSLLLYLKYLIICVLLFYYYQNFIKVWYLYYHSHCMALVHKYHFCISHTTSNDDHLHHVYCAVLVLNHTVLTHNGSP